MDNGRCMVTRRMLTQLCHSQRLPAARLSRRALRSDMQVHASQTITNKTIVVTGASQGIGLEFARQFASKGNHVIAAVRRTTPELEDLAKSSGALITQLDVSSPESIQGWAISLKEKLQGKHIDYVINNAGAYGPRKTLREVTAEDMNFCFQVNTIGPLLVTQQLLNNNLIGPPASVVANVTSKVASVDDNRSGGGYAYRASKSALNIVNKSMSIDLAAEDITCVLLHPGYVRTRMTNGNGLIDASESVAGLIAVLESDRPLSGHWYDFAGKEIPW